MESLMTMTSRSFHLVLTALTLSLMSPALVAGGSNSNLSEEGMELVNKTRHGEVQVRPDANWGNYTQILLEPATVEFRKNWARDQKNRNGNRPTEAGMNRIKSDLTELVDEVFRQELTKDNAYTIWMSRAENVLLITPRIVNLDVVAPDRMRDHIGYSLTDSQGSMTLELDIYDSVSGTLLARMTDSRMDPHKGYMEWTTTVTNQRAARFMLIRWAVKLREWLLDAR